MLDHDGTSENYVALKAESLRRFFMAYFGPQWRRELAARLGQKQAPLWMRATEEWRRRHPFRSLAVLGQLEDVALSLGYRPSLVLTSPRFGRR